MITRKNVGMLGVFAALAVSTNGGMIGTPFDDIPGDDPQPKIPVTTIPHPTVPCPPGAKTYFFDKHGEFEIGRMLRERCVFICHAMNDKNAKRKFSNYLKTLSSP